MADKPTVYEAFAAVMDDVQAIRKGQQNRQQGFNFRGIDAVMQAVGPSLRKHGVVIVPEAQHVDGEVYETAKGTRMMRTVVRMGYTVYGPDGSSFSGVSYGEAADSGDKGVTKAQSVAYRTFLLQALTVPTDDPEPDAEVHERVRPQQPVQRPWDMATAESRIKFVAGDVAKLREAWQEAKHAGSPEEVLTIIAAAAEQAKQPIEGVVQ